jgi:hypothetical protein
MPSLEMVPLMATDGVIAGPAGTGRIDETEADAYASRAHYGAPDYEVEGWVTSYLAIRHGEMSPVTDVVERVIGRPPRSLRDFLAA